MLRRLKRNQQGFTLIELLLVIALTGIIGTVAAMSIHQILTGTVHSNDQNTAINQVRNAGYWICRDALMAQSVNTTGELGLPLTLTLTQGGVEYQVTYMLKGVSGSEFKELWRDSGDQQTPIAQYIDNTNCDWDPDEKLLTVTITATVGDKTETRTFQVKPRPDQLV